MLFLNWFVTLGSVTYYQKQQGGARPRMRPAADLSVKEHCRGVMVNSLTEKTSATMTVAAVKVRLA